MEHGGLDLSEAGPCRLVERLEDDLGPHVIGDGEPEHPRRSLVANGAHVSPAIADCEVGDIGRPQLVDPLGMELAIHQVLGEGGAWIGGGGDLEQAWAHPDDPEAGHAGGHGVGAHPLPGLMEVQGDPRSAVGALRALVQGDDLPKPSQPWGTGEFIRGTTGNYEAVRALCKDCPVRRECLEVALADDSLVGLWAGRPRRNGERCGGGVSVSTAT